MAYQVVVSPLIGVVFDKLNSLIQNKFGEVRGVQKEMKKLSKTLSKIKSFLNDAEEKQVADEEIRDWLDELKDAAYKADDTLEEWAFRDQQLAPEKVTDSLKELMESFDGLTKDMVEFHLQRGVVQKRPEICSDRETGALLTEPKVYGREKEEKELVKLLLDQCPPQNSHHPRGQRQSQDQVSSQEDIFICPILGMGGLGKTTLAQLVYNNGQVTKHFQIRAWVCVSDNFDATRLIKLILDSVSQGPCILEALAPLQQRLQDELRGKRFLLVLDDVWDSNQDKWNKLRVSLACGAKGSCVIVTTRLKTVAAVSGTCLPYDLKVLSNKACWRLFKQRAFGLENAKREPLEEIGKQIVAKCRGLPLAAKAMGGLLRFENKESRWLSIRDSEIWELPQDGENDILPVLTLSYNHLSPVLKQCFAYCSIFPKDNDINIKNLIHLWMANGLILCKGNVDLEDAGVEIFRTLLWRSMFQEIRKDEAENMLTCKMHDLVHDLACYMARNESSALNVENADAESAGNITKRIRHLSMSRQQILPLASSSQGLRSLVWFGQRPIEVYESAIFFFCLTRLRALDLHECNIEMVPDCIGEMIHLRYLNLSGNGITSLPESICGLKNVQTLNLRLCGSLQSLPKDMSQMINLRHLEIGGCYMLPRMPIDMGKLICLHTLSIFIVGLENGCSIKELQGLNHLQGKLEIKKLENVKNSMESKEANLRSKKNLRSLTLWWSWSEGLEEEVQENVIESLQPHSNLRRCFVRGYQGVIFPNWLMTVSAVPNLVQISLEGCRRCVRFPPLGKLPVLKTLNISSMDSVKFIDGEVYGEGEGKGFPSLESLVLINMPNLEGWSSSLQATTSQQILLPHLKNLRLLDCPKLKGPVPLSSSLRLLDIAKCNETVLGYVRDLPCLSRLFIKEFDELVNFPEGALQNLTSLDGLSIMIMECKKLKALPVEVERLTTLKTLMIRNCWELISLGEKNLSSLETLVILHCPNLKRLPKFNKTCLDELRIRDCPELELSTEEDFEDDLPLLESLELNKVPKLRGGFLVGLKHATMLWRLTLLGCWSKEEENEMDLPEWIGSLKSLQSLSLDGCKNRKVLPEGLQNLTALGYLCIYGCDEELERRCEKDKGEDWFKIAHVTHVNITSSRWNGSLAKRLNKAKVPCDLITGEENVVVEGAKHKSVIVEMADASSDYQCAFIDEIQMVGCKSRGFSFTRALLGISADELHLCGDATAAPLIQEIPGE